MTIDKLNLPKFLISIVASIMLYWLYIDIPLIHKMTTFQITFNFLSIFIIGGEAIYLLLVLYKIYFVCGGSSTGSTDIENGVGRLTMFK